MTRATQARLLVRPLWRAGTWWLIPAGAAAVLAVRGLLTLAGAPPQRAVPVALGGFVLAAAAGFALDDASARTVAAVPAPPAFRAGLRLLGAYAAVAACWALLLAGTGAVARPTLLFATLVTTGLLAASWWGGLAAGPAVLAFLALAAQVPDRWGLLDPSRDAGRRLAVVLAVAAAALLARCGRDRTGY